jgi:hypothetical protein
MRSGGSMKKTLSLLATLFLLNGCAESVALLGPASSAISGGNIAQSTFSTALGYGVKKQTGKSPSEHAFAFVEKHNPERKKDTCISFIEKTNSEMCEILKKKISLTKAKISNNKKNQKAFTESSSSLQSKIDKKSKIKYLD